MLKLDVDLRACMTVSVFHYMVWTKRKVMHSVVRIERPEQSAFNAGTAYCSNSCIEDSGAVVGKFAYRSSATNNNSSIVLNTVNRFSKCTTKPSGTDLRKKLNCAQLLTTEVSSRSSCARSAASLLCC